MQLILTALPLSVLFSLTAAAGTCTSSGSKSWPPVGDCSASSATRYPTAVQICRACCLNDGDCFQKCAKTAGIGKRETAGDLFFGAIREKRELASRAVDLSCTGNEDCYKFTDGSLLCLDLGTGKFENTSLICQHGTKLTRFATR
jgi:hypothetical protein